MFIGGCSLERHVKNARENAPAYAYRKIGTDGKKREKGKMSLEMVLADEDWDYVSLQQASTFPECMRRMKPLFPSSSSM